jgi:hypothetical protein
MFTTLATEGIALAVSLTTALVSESKRLARDLSSEVGAAMTSDVSAVASFFSTDWTAGINAGAV